MKQIFLFFRQFFKISYQEARGVSALLVVSLVLLFIIFFPDFLVPNKNAVDPAEVHKLDSLASLLRPRTVSRFPFNPNITSKDSLLLIGIPEHIANRIIKYRENGGQFEVKNDLRKIYGISTELVDSLYLWIDLSENRSGPAASQTQPFDINLANEQQLKNLKTIGDILASRILKYRDLLGGFVTKEQFNEVYGLSDEALAHLTSSTFIVSNFKPNLIRVNRSSFQELVRHPYISTELARDILRYREINSTIESEKVLAVFKSVDKSNFEKLILYLDFQ